MQKSGDETNLVLRGAPDKLPVGAILISENEAAMRQWELVHSWRPLSEIWPLRYGHIILGTAVGITSTLITSYYRRRLKLGTYGQLTTQIPTVLVPSICAGFSNVKFVTTPIMLQNECPVCIQLRSVAIQTIAGVAYPLLLAPLAAFGYAYNHGSYDLPELSLKNAKFYFQLFCKFTSKYKQTLGFLVAGNSLLATYMTYKSGTTFIEMHQKMVRERAELQENIHAKISNEKTAVEK